MPPVPTTRFYRPCSDANQYAVQRRYPRYSSVPRAHVPTALQAQRTNGPSQRGSSATPTTLTTCQHTAQPELSNPMTLYLASKERRILLLLPHTAFSVPHSHGRSRWRGSWAASLCVNAPIRNCTGDTALSCVLQVRPQTAPMPYTARAGGLRLCCTRIYPPCHPCFPQLTNPPNSCKITE